MTGRGRPHHRQPAGAPVARWGGGNLGLPGFPGRQPLPSVFIPIRDQELNRDVGLGFAVAWDKPGGFIGREALLAARVPGPPRRQLAQFLLENPEPLLHGGEPILRDSRWFGHRAGAYGHTLGGAVGFGMVEDEAGIPVEVIQGGRFETDIAGTRYPARASVRPLYDPDRPPHQELRTIDERRVGSPTARTAAWCSRAPSRGCGVERCPPNRTDVLARPTGVERADAINIRIPIEGAGAAVDRTA